MKTITLSALAALGIALGTSAQQGNFVLDNGLLTNGLAIDAPGQSYNGTFGMEVWVLKETEVPAGINQAPAPASGLLAYNAMVWAGFVRQATYTNQQTVSPGAFALRQVFLPIAHHGEQVIVALAAWNTPAASFSQMLASANAATRAGVIVFAQPTFQTCLNPGIPPGLALDQDLVLTAVPAPPMPASRVRPAGNTNAAPRQAAPVRKAPS